MPETPLLIQTSSASHSQMMGYILQSRDGSLIVVDGGCAANAPRLLETLKKLGGEKPHVSLWVLTHPHQDHIFGFISLMTEHQGELTVGKVVQGFPRREFLEQYAADEVPELQAFEDIRHELPVVTVKRGDRFSCGDFAFEVIYANEVSCPENPCNNSSTVYRAEVLGTTVLFPGDMGPEAEERLLDRPEKLKADIVQMAHHGQGGISKAVYDHIRPKLCLWPTMRWLWENDGGKGPGTGPFMVHVTRQWMEKLNVTSHLVSKDGDSFVRFLGEGRFTFGRWQLR